jgi:16S rRNA (guanine527-N7)-methyltransferase
MDQTMPEPRTVTALARELGRELSPTQAKGLADYLGLLTVWNRRTNLVGPKSWPDMLRELVADSWHLADLLSGLPLPAEALVLDFGAGAGIPGVPLRLFWPQGQYVLIEPRAKRAGFLRQCLAQMKVTATTVFEGRDGDLREADGRGRADVCLSRAFKPWPEFLETAREFLRPGVGIVVVFASQPEPRPPLPQGFGLHLSKPYTSRGGTGYFWVFAPAKSPKEESLNMSRVAT